MTEPNNGPAAPFDSVHAADYGSKSRIALAGYDACHELAACMLIASLGPGGPKRILIVGAGGTAQEIINLAQLEPEWRFVGIDTSQPMLERAKDRLRQVSLIDETVGQSLATPQRESMAFPGKGQKTASVRRAGREDRVDLRPGTVLDLPAAERFDGAMMIGVLHHVPGDGAKAATLKAVADRLKPGGALILAGNFLSFASQPLMLKASAERWRMYGDIRDEVDQKLAKAQGHSQPAESEEALFALLSGAGFDQPLRFFTSLFWGAWAVQKK